jgi:threonine/homoserine/homoserine lactone efflux protein
MPMPDIAQFALYAAAAFLLAITPGPGIFYVAARTLRRRHRVGLTLAARPDT